VKNIIGAAQPTPPPEVQLLVVDEESDGQRLDNWLMRHLKGAPKTLVYRIIRSGEVRVNKGRASADTRVATGDRVRVPPLRLAAKPVATVSATGSAAVVPARQFPVLYEDEGILAIDKPAGVAVHGGSGISHGVIEQLRQARPSAHLLELVHRLDRETSGVLLVAKKRSVLRQLQDQFRQRETGKTYLTLVPGQWPSRQKVIDMPLQRYLVPNGQGEGERRVRVVGKDDPDGQRAITLVRVARLVGGFSLLEVTIKTGRTHQIRVHLSSLGYPIVGDDKYGNFERNREWHKAGLQRMFLHAWRLQFIHPQTLRPVNLESPLPLELQAFLDHVQPPNPPL
jgi:23S rRNA pseudouridine955/2504/2580 synthase